ESSRKSRSQSVPSRHEAVRSRHVSSSSSPPTVDGFGTGTPSPALRANPFRFCSDPAPSLLIEAWLLPRRAGIGRALQRHPFSGLRAVGHRNPASGSSRIASSAYQKWPTWSSRFRGMAQQSSHPVLPI
ncbi:unnamed protein product, partial [Brassica napus]